MFLFIVIEILLLDCRSILLLDQRNRENEMVKVSVKTLPKIRILSKLLEKAMT